MNKQVEKIKKEIERRFNDNIEASQKFEVGTYVYGMFVHAAKEDNDLLGFIESIEDKPETETSEQNEHFIQEDTDEEMLVAARRASVDDPNTPLEYLSERPYIPAYEQKFIEGAVWQKNRDRLTC